MRGEDTEKTRENMVNFCSPFASSPYKFIIFSFWTNCFYCKPKQNLPGPQAFACLGHIAETGSLGDLDWPKPGRHNPKAAWMSPWPKVRHALSCCNGPEKSPGALPSASETAFPSSSSGVSPRSPGAFNTSAMSGSIRRISLASWKA